MAFRSTLARSIDLKAIALLIVGIGLFSACTSPLDLDVERSRTFVDGAKNPTRLSFYYHFGDSAYEALVTDPTFLAKIWIEPQVGSEQLTITVPQFIFQLPINVTPTAEHNPLVKTLCFASHQQPTDGVFRSCTNQNSWMEGLYLDERGDPTPFNWMADNTGRQIRLAYYNVPEENLIKGSMQVIVTEPIYGQNYASYRALITLEY